LAVGLLVERKVRQGKGNKARTVPLNASARQALAESEERSAFDLGDAADD
jgi:hypothetical protein